MCYGKFEMLHSAAIAQNLFQYRPRLCHCVVKNEGRKVQAQCEVRYKMRQGGKNAVNGVQRFFGTVTAVSNYDAECKVCEAL